MERMAKASLATEVMDNSPILTGKSLRRMTETTITSTRIIGGKGLRTGDDPLRAVATQTSGKVTLTPAAVRSTGDRNMALHPKSTSNKEVAASPW